MFFDAARHLLSLLDSCVIVVTVVIVASLWLFAWMMTVTSDQCDNVRQRFNKQIFLKHFSDFHDILWWFTWICNYFTVVDCWLRKERSRQIINGTFTTVQATVKHNWTGTTSTLLSSLILIRWKIKREKWVIRVLNQFGRTWNNNSWRLTSLIYNHLLIQSFANPQQTKVVRR